MVDLAIVVGLLFLGIFLIWLAKLAQLEFGEASKAAVLLAPLVVYLIVAGKVGEFEGLGWKAKFRSITASSVISAARAADLATTSEQVDLADFFSEALWQLCRPYYVLTDTSAKTRTGEIDKKAALHIATAIRSSMICGRFKALVVIDAQRKPVGFFPRAHFLELLRTILVAYGDVRIDGDTIFREIMSSELGVILQNPVARAKSDEAVHESVSWNADIETVYKKLNASGAEVSLISDRLGRFDGIITRIAIEGRIIEGLLVASK